MRVLVIGMVMVMVTVMVMVMVMCNDVAAITTLNSNAFWHVRTPPGQGHVLCCFRP